MEVILRECFSILILSSKISDHPLATNGSVHKLLIKADMMGIKKEREVEIGVVRNASKLDRQTKTRAFLDFNTTQVNSTELIFEKG